MDKEIQDAFVDGLNEVYSIMFTDGVSDGVNLYLLSPCLLYTSPSPRD